MANIEQQVLLFIQHIYNLVQWPGVVLLMAIESACIPLPSEVIMPLAGWMLIKNQALSPWYTALAGAYGALGCTIGSAAAYWVGHKGGRPLVLKYGKYILVSHKDLDRADGWFARHGGAAAFFSRLLPVVRTFISFPAGVARMRFRTFLGYTFAGSFPWCWALAYGGYLLGEHWESLRAVMRPFDIPIIVVFLILAAIYIYHRLRELKTRKA